MEYLVSCGAMDLCMRVISASPQKAEEAFRVAAYLTSSDKVTVAPAPTLPHVSTLYRETHDGVYAPAYKNQPI